MRWMAFAGLAAAILAVWPLATWLQHRSRYHLDSQIAAEAEGLARQTLLLVTQTNRSAAAKVGTFRKFSGSGFHRPSHSWMVIPRLEVLREGEFTRAKVPVRIYVVVGQTIRVLRIDYWPKQGGRQPSWDLARIDDLAIDVWISHPEFRR
jgi:hypothetical protein